MVEPYLLIRSRVIYRMNFRFDFEGRYRVSRTDDFDHEVQGYSILCDVYY